MYNKIHTSCSCLSMYVFELPQNSIDYKSINKPKLLKDAVKINNCFIDIFIYLYNRETSFSA